MITLLPRQQLLGLHRECCALRGNGWGKKHATVDFVFRHSPYKLFHYHEQLLRVIRQRGYFPAP
ncbi:pyrimidine dimer DNA glycosylase/endonuclease V, partial [Enterococcus faecium]|uniref:pyrimidine dimer DNA glycosylase/endonuclease V n=1 Tax=Enterococcus faecium TaxID=1352 RepID=UPI003CC631D4